MKNKLHLILCVLCLSLTSCFDIEETYQLNADGSYALSYNVDIGEMLNMANSLVPDSIKQSAAYAIKKDSTIQLSAIPDSVKYKFNEKELDMLNRSNMRTQMDMKAGIFKVAITNKGNSIAALNYYLSNFDQVFKKSKIGQTIIDPLFEAQNNGNLAATTDAYSGSDNTHMPLENKQYDYIITAHSFERRIRPEVLIAANEKKQAIFDIMNGMDMKLTNTIVINLPRPAKSVENSKATLSANKRQFKLTLDMMDVVAHPELLNFKVNY